MTNSGQGKYSINIGQITGGEVQVGDRTYANASPANLTPAAGAEARQPAQRTILVLAASPVDRSHEPLGREVREIDAGLRLGKHRNLLHLEQRWAVRPEDLRRSLLEIQPQILHFCGEAGETQGLALENALGQTQWVATDALSDLFKLFASRGLECVVLNACYSTTQAAAIAQHVRWVIGMTAAIERRAAILFAVGFYDALGAGWSYQDAYELGCNAIALEGIPQDLIPVLHGGESHPSL